MKILNATEALLSLINLSPVAQDEAAINERKACALRDLRRTFADDNLTDCAFGVLQASTEDLRANTPVAVCTTSRGQQLVFFPEFVAVDGQLEPAVRASGNYGEQSALQARSMLDMGLRLLKTLAKSLAKEAGKELGKQVFEAVFGSDGDDLKKDLEELKGKLQDFMIQLKYEGLEDQLEATRYWLSTTYDGYQQAYARGEQVPMQKIYDALEKHQEEMQTLSTTIARHISEADLAGCSYEIRNRVLLHAATFLMGSLLIVHQIKWRNRLAETEAQHRNHVLESILTAYVRDQADTSERFLNKLDQGRHAHISEVKPAQEINTSAASGDGPIMPSTSYYWHWSDTFESDIAEDPFVGKKIYDAQYYFNVGKEDDRAAAKARAKDSADANRRQHLAAVDGLFADKLSNPLKDAIAAARKRAADFQRVPVA